MIDWNRVIELRDEVGAEDLMEVVELFLEEVETVLGDLSKDVSNDELSSQMHFLKGSSLNIGFSDMAALCAQGETDAAAGNTDTIDLNTIQSCYATSKSAFLAELKLRIAA